MAQKIQRGEKIPLTAPSGGVVSGQGYVIGEFFVIAEHDAAEGEQFVGNRAHVFPIPKSTSVAFSEGDPIYWDEADEEANDDPANKCVAIACEDTADSAATVPGLIIGVALGDVASLTSRMDEQERVYSIDGTAGDTATMSNTSEHTFTTKTTVPAKADGYVGRWCNWECEILVSGAVSTPAITAKLYLGTAALESQVIATAAANDGVVLKGRMLINSATSARVYKGLGYTKDSTVAYQTPIAPADLTIQTLTSARDVTASVTSDAGNAGNTAVIKSLRFEIEPLAAA